MIIRNWERYQPKMKDRDVIWIKLYRRILEDYEWHNLSSDSKATLIELLLLASENNGKLPTQDKIAFRLRKDIGFVEEQLHLLSHWLQDVDKMLPSCEQDVPLEKRREEKSREEHTSSEDDEWEESFNNFWTTYPKTVRKVGKESAKKKWKAKKLYKKSDTIINHIKTMAQTKQWKDGYIPAPLTYINQERWNDEVPEKSVQRFRGVEK